MENMSIDNSSVLVKEEEKMKRWLEEDTWSQKVGGGVCVDFRMEDNRVTLYTDESGPVGRETSIFE